VDQSTRANLAGNTDLTAEPVALKRRLGLPLLVLYGVGITVGAGIYVLIGAVAGYAGIHAPWSFLLAGLVMAFTVASYAELSTRYPVSAGEAAYVRAAFGSRLLSTLTGLVTVAIGIVSTAAVAIGSAGYIEQFVDLPQPAIAFGIILLLGAVAAWGILESVLLAGFFTLVEVGGLLLIIGAALTDGITIDPELLRPPVEPSELAGVAFASLLAFFAFIGFEDLANAVEEAKTPHRDLPLAMTLTLAISALLYVAVAVVAVSAVPVGELSASPAPLSLVFQRLAGIDPIVITAIAVVATLNTILAQMTMASRVIYGMARQGDLPVLFGRVNRLTRTPVLGTALVAMLAIALTLLASLESLAESTSLATLVVFAVVNLALLQLRRRRITALGRHVRVPIWVPAAGLATCLLMLAAAFVG
jgi:basic amino acid/polyamine antiporter, APA family